MKTKLTWQDIKAIVNIADAMLEDSEMRIAVQNHGEEYYYTKILEEYKKQYENITLPYHRDGLLRPRGALRRADRKKALGIITLGGILFVRDYKNSNGYFDKWLAQEGGTVWKLVADKTTAAPYYELFCRDETQEGRELWTRLFASSSLDKISDYMDKR